ncbi:MAG: hypothetical protein D6770_08360, partial [Anaerolineae bacterium]
AALRAFLEAQPTIERLGRYTFRINGREVDFSAAAALPPPPTWGQRLIGAALGWAADARPVLRLNWQQGEAALRKRLGDE